MLPLTRDDRDTLVANLLAELEPNETTRRRNIQDLVADIRRKETVDGLSRNPLFCTTLVLVYKYQGTTLPERRVDVYQELVKLMLGFWDTHKMDSQGVADVHELVLQDGTGRLFHDERDAVEAKERALIQLAFWMQTEGHTEVEKKLARQYLSDFFHNYEGAAEEEQDQWARNFLDVAHQRSGLFVEYDTGTYAFSHKNFLEYLAATALVDKSDREMLDLVLAHAEDPSWEEVIRLAFAHEKLPRSRFKLLLDGMLAAEHIVLAGKCAVDAGARLPLPLRRPVQNALYAAMTVADKKPTDRFAAGETLDELGWLPDDLHAWVRCPGCADNRHDLYVAKYPVTNAQYAVYVAATGKEPANWHDARFGKEKRGYPVVTVTWYDAVAYAKWLTDLLERGHEDAAALSPEELALVADLLAAGAQTVRLPSSEEWVRFAGGDEGDRYPWDKPGRWVTKEESGVIQRANTRESGIRQTTPVAMYPQGAGHRFELMDLAGNVWEWTSTETDGGMGRVLRGGSWYFSHDLARVAARYDDDPRGGSAIIGFRVVSPVVSGS